MHSRTLLDVAGAFAAGILLCTAGVTQDPVPPAEIPADTGVQTTESGLKYSVLEPGDGGAKPSVGDRVTVHYTGWLADGTKFDSSRDRGQPAEFTLGKVIAGWNEGLALMSKGARFKLTIPYDLAYGEQGRPPVIPPKATLIFDVELLDITAQPKPVDFAELDPEKTKTTESGLKYEIVKEGKGDPPGENQGFAARFAFWSPQGKLLDCSEWGNGPIEGQVGAFTMSFLNEGPALLAEGGAARFVVPAELGFGDEVPPGTDMQPGDPTVWYLEMQKVYAPLPVPEFAAPDAEQQQTTASGLKYEVLEDGDPDGARPTLGSEVTVHYAGWLTDGTLFDNSYQRGKPATFQLGRVIRGWNEGLQLMSPGAKYRFEIPSALGYGEQGSPPTIPGGATLIFVVELLEVGR